MTRVITAIQKNKIKDLEKIVNKEGTEGWLNSVNKKGESPLIKAIETGNVDISKYLLKQKVKNNS